MIRTIADDWTVLLVHAVEFEMASSMIGVIGGMRISELCEERTRIFCERVEEDTVY